MDMCLDLVLEEEVACSRVRHMAPDYRAIYAGVMPQRLHDPVEVCVIFFGNL
jgi:hypothetical protein